MQLSLHADFALRVLVYLGTHPDRVVTTQEISNAYGISKHHLVRVIHTLAVHQYVNIQAGRSGGVMLPTPRWMRAAGSSDGGSAPRSIPRTRGMTNPFAPRRRRLGRA